MKSSMSARCVTHARYRSRGHVLLELARLALARPSLPGLGLLRPAGPHPASEGISVGGLRGASSPLPNRWSNGFDQRLNRSSTLSTTNPMKTTSMPFGGDATVEGDKAVEVGLSVGVGAIRVGKALADEVGNPVHVEPLVREVVRDEPENEEEHRVGDGEQEGVGQGGAVGVGPVVSVSGAGAGVVEGPVVSVSVGEAGSVNSGSVSEAVLVPSVGGSVSSVPVQVIGRIPASVSAVGSYVGEPVNVDVFFGAEHAG